MANTTTLSPNMNLTIPTTGVDPGPTYAQDINNCLTLIDAHNHSPGYGEQVTPAGININTDLPMNSHNLTLVNTLSYTGAAVGTPSILSVYTNGTDLFYKDASANSIQLTRAGGPNAGTGNIQNLPSTPTGGAGISWVNAQNTFQFLSDAGTVGANRDGAALIIRYPGSYPTPSGNYISLQAPTTLSTGFAFTLPATLPGASGAFLTSTTSGTLSYTNVDNSTLTIGSNQIKVATGGITSTQIAARTIVTNNIALQAVTTNEIANSTILGGNVAANINLPGNAVQENAMNVVVSAFNNTTSAKILYGTVDGSGGIISGGGFTISGSPPGYNVSFDVNFASSPSVLVSVVSGGPGYAVVNSIGTSGFVVTTYDSTATPNPTTFSFIVIGPR